MTTGPSGEGSDSSDKYRWREEKSKADGLVSHCVPPKCSMNVKDYQQLSPAFGPPTLTLCL